MSVRLGLKRFVVTLSILAPVVFAGGPKAEATLPSPTAGYADLVQPLLPAVVNISTTTLVRPNSGLGGAGPNDLPFPKGSQLEDFFKEFLDRMQPDGPRNANAVGSGFIISSEGHIVTNNHLIADADQITVILSDNTELKATLVGRDRRTDIAVLKINSSKKLPFVQWGNSEKLRTGDSIIAIGNPFGLGGTVTTGIVSHLGRDIGSQTRSGDFVEGYIQTDASINLGNSGGPMFDMNGKVVGVNTAIYSPTGASVGIGFAIPSEIAKKVVDQIVQYGRTKRGWIGVHIQPITEDIAEALGLKKTSGALVGNVVKGGPAAKAKLQSGDVIIKVGDFEVKDQRSLPRIVGNMAVGSSIPVTIWRKGKVSTFPVKIGEYEEAEEAGVIPSPDGRKELVKGTKVQGLTLQSLTEDLRQRFDITPDAQGVLIVDVAQGSAAAEKGLRPGDVIMEICQEEVKTPQHVVDHLKKAEGSKKSALVLINRDGEPRYISFKICPEGEKN